MPRMKYILVLHVIHLGTWGAACCAPTREGERSLQTRADFHILEKSSEDGAALGADGSGDDHAVRFHTAELSRGEIDDHSDLAANEGLRLVILGDSRANLANLRADIHRQLEQFIGASDALGGLDLANAHLDLGEILDGNLLRRGLCRGPRPAGGSARSGWRRNGLLSFVFHRFHPLYRFLVINPWKNSLDCSDSSPRLELSPVQLVNTLLREDARLTQLFPNLVRSSGKHWMR